MRKIIGGKLYDTETAELICVNDIHDCYECWHIYEHLYKKVTGEYFLFRTMIGDGDAEYELNWTLQHMFQALSKDETKKWMESYATVEEYEQEFGLPEE